MIGHLLASIPRASDARPMRDFVIECARGYEFWARMPLADWLLSGACGAIMPGSRLYATCRDVRREVSSGARVVDSQLVSRLHSLA